MARRLGSQQGGRPEPGLRPFRNDPRHPRPAEPLTPAPRQVEEEPYRIAGAPLSGIFSVSPPFIAERCA